MHWQQAWQVWLSIQFTGVRNGYGSTRWQPGEAKRLVAMFMAPVTPDVDQASANCTLEETHVFLKSLHLRQSDFFGHAPPLGTTSWMKITIDIGHGNLFPEKTKLVHRSWIYLQWQLARHTACLNQRSLRWVILTLCEWSRPKLESIQVVRKRTEKGFHVEFCSQFLWFHFSMFYLVLESLQSRFVTCYCKDRNAESLGVEIRRVKVQILQRSGLNCLKQLQEKNNYSTTLVPNSGWQPNVL